MPYEKTLLFFAFIAFSMGVIAQAVAVDDTLYFSLGETININPLTNDYDESGGESKLLMQFPILE